MIFQYDNKVNTEPNGLKIKVQIRTRLQHIWATTVETLGTFMETSLKSSEGPEQILEFLSLTSSAFSCIEKSAINSYHKNYTKQELFEKVIKQYNSLNIASKLKGFTVAANHIDKTFNKSKYQYYLITLDLHNRMARVRQYLNTEIDKANTDYTEVERSISAGADMQVVLVSTDKISALSKAYPNYFLDTTDFIKQIEKIKSQIN